MDQQIDRETAIRWLLDGPVGIKRWNEHGEARCKVNLSGSDFKNANLSGADLSGVSLCDANLFCAKLDRADLEECDLSRAFLTGAFLTRANIIGANLSEARLTKTYIHFVNFIRCDIDRADFTIARLRSTNFVDVDMSVATGLDQVRHDGPSSIGTESLIKSKGKIPEVFLRGCGLAPWEVQFARLYRDDLDDAELAELLTTKVFEARSKGPIYIGGVFISYAASDPESGKQTDDVKFVEKIRRCLYDAGASVWLDSHDMVAGNIQKQVGRALRLQDIVLLVLSASSIKSDWVEHELEMAHKKEKEEGRDVLCPVALDNSWKAKVEDDVLWRQLKKKHVLDFSAWKTKKFSQQLDKLVKGLRLNYEGTR
jgi:uncharacterized protein YjbI with pentapeptide repeats